MKGAIIAEAESDAGYDWEVVALLRGEDGGLYLAFDSGCSCSYKWSYGDGRAARVQTWQEAVAKVASGNLAPYSLDKALVEMFRDRVIEERPRGGLSHADYQRRVDAGATVIEVKS